MTAKKKVSKRAAKTRSISSQVVDLQKKVARSDSMVKQVRSTIDPPESDEPDDEHVIAAMLADVSPMPSSIKGFRKQISIFVPIKDWRLLRGESCRRSMPVTDICRECIRPLLKALHQGRVKTNTKYSVKLVVEKR